MCLKTLSLSLSLSLFTRSTLQTNTCTFANTADLDETDRNEASNRNLHYLRVFHFFLLKTLIAPLDVSKFRDRRAHFRKLGRNVTVRNVLQTGTSRLLQALSSRFLNPSTAELGYALLLQTVYIQISWLVKKPTDLDLHCLSFNM